MRKLLACVVLIHCFSLSYAQKKLILDKVEVKNIESLDNDKEHPNMTLAQLSETYCQNLSTIKEGGNIVEKMGYALQPIFEGKEILDSLAFILVRTSVNLDSARLEVVKNMIQMTIESCPVVDSILGFDGKQRPAYAHVSKLICKCLQNTKVELIESQIYTYKYGFFKDSCTKSVYSDEEARKIVFTANDFQTQAQITEYDKNFVGYFFKNCSEETDLIIGYLSDIWRHAALSLGSYSDGIEVLSARQNNMRSVINTLNGNHFSAGSRYVRDLFIPNGMNATVVNSLNNAQLVLKNQKNIDWLQDDNQAYNQPTSYKLSVYKYIVQTKKRVLLCQLVFDFYDENKRELISDFRFISKSQIENLQDVENRINKKY